MKYRAEQVGSLLRPAALLSARSAKLPPEELHAVEDQAIAAALAKQRSIGMDVLTDGEFRRGSWLTDMADAVDGFARQRVILDWKGPGGGPEGSTALAVGAKLHKARKLTAHEVPFLKREAGGTLKSPFKITVPAPSNFLVSSYKAGLTDAFYPTPQELLDDLVEILRDEVAWLVSQGVPYIQFDAPYYSHFVDPARREMVRRAGGDPDRDFEMAVAGDNKVFADIPRERITLGLHICRGNSRSRWFTEGGYDAIAEKLFGSVGVDRFLLEYDDQRSGGFEPLRLVPRGKTVVLGLITTKDPRMEADDALRRRIDEAAKYVPLENLAISPQCGFASVAAGNLLTEDQQWRKLELVVKTARAVWG